MSFLAAPMFFVPAAAAAALWTTAAYTWSLKNQASIPAENEIGNAKEPFYGAWMDYKQMWGVDTRGRFVSVTEDIDVYGAKVFLVDYGTGAKTVQYHDPRCVL